MTSTPEPEQERPSVFNADPIAGLDARAGGLNAGEAHRHGTHRHATDHHCADHHDAHGTPSAHSAHSAHDAAQARAAGFVRPARPEDLPAIGSIHAVTMRASLEAAHDSAHGAPLPEGVRAMISAPVITAGWQEAVGAPPSPHHHVLVATQDGEVVGLLGLAPTQSVSPEGEPEAPSLAAAEVTALVVAPEHQLRGHGSRLLAAAVDLARQDGAGALVAWSVRGDESLNRLFQAVGMAPTGARRQLPVGQGVIEDCWAAAL